MAVFKATGRRRTALPIPLVLRPRPRPPSASSISLFEVSPCIAKAPEYISTTIREAHSRQLLELKACRRLPTIRCTILSKLPSQGEAARPLHQDYRQPIILRIRFSPHKTRFLHNPPLLRTYRLMQTLIHIQDPRVRRITTQLPLRPSSQASRPTMLSLRRLSTHLQVMGLFPEAWDQLVWRPLAPFDIILPTNRFPTWADQLSCPTSTSPVVKCR
jgi:hypothetical protein